MNKKTIGALIFIVIGLPILWLAYTYFALGRDYVPYGGASSASSTGTFDPTATSTPYAIEEFVRGLEVPWSIAWTSPNRMLVTERPGRLRVVSDGALVQKPLMTFEDVRSVSEAGLMAVAVDPDYARNNFLYACYAYTSGGEMKGKVVRLLDNANTNAATVDKVLVDNIPSARNHAGCRVMFGPDGKLYITTGDASERALAQDLTSLAGKILRIESDGSIPSDNPFPGSAIWSYGHRNPQGIGWHPKTGELYETEHGPSVFDGPAGGDEVNRIVKGGNFGWPLVSHGKKREGTQDALAVFTPAEAPASAAFYPSIIFKDAQLALPQFENNFFFGALKGEGLFRAVIDPANPSRISSYEKMADVRYGRIREVASGPDGFIYFTTSNRDGRGNARSGDDKIYRIRPQQ